MNSKIQSEFRNLLLNVFESIVNEVHDIMDELGENKDEYRICIHPFILERKDGKPIPRRLLEAIEAKFQADQEAND